MPEISHCPAIFSTQQCSQKYIACACLLARCLVLNSSYWVAAQKILLCREAYYIQLHVWEVNLFGLKHQ